MRLTSLRLTNFKNIPSADLSLSHKLNCFLGDNGMGKSNLLDAIYFLSFCKSFTGVTDAQVISRDEDFAMLTATYVRRDTDETLQVGLQRARRKSFKRGGKEYQRLSEHIGKFPLVMVSPADMSLVDGSGEERRRLADMVISQTDPAYLDALIRYNRALEQRNRMLRDGVADPDLYCAVEAAMEASARYICDRRARWVERLSEIFTGYYSAISADSEQATLTYSSHLADPDTRLTDLFNERRHRDLAMKYTTAGPQRDDILMELSGMPVRRVASQGQAKSYTIALRLAQYDFLKAAVGIAPLLLLDDVFDKLDANRMERIMQVVSGDNFGQIFITDTNRKHLDEILQHTSGDCTLWSVDHGQFSELPFRTPAP